jgi:hypothetical protein
VAFVAPMVHDFAWAADKIIYDVVTGPNDVYPFPV